MTRKFLVIISLILALGLNAGTREDFRANYKRSANNYQAYPDDTLPALTAAPEGYKPFYINHYGRHGSRWLINPDTYANPVAQLEKALKAGKLTTRGKQVLAICKQVKEASYKRLGELSDIGAEQHQRIARRMMENFPEVFAGDVEVDAKSTVVIRCILSMLNEVKTLKAMNPQLRITTDASYHDMFFMNYADSVAFALRKDAFKEASKDLKARYLDSTHLFKCLFKDQKWAKNNIEKPKEFLLDIFDVAANMQSHHQFENVNLYDLFSEDDRVNIWAYNNARWYFYAGNTPLTNGRVHYMESNLLRNFLATTDAALAGGRNRADLRFGHESVVLPFVCLMGMNGMDLSTDDVYSLVDTWQSYKVFPMAANVQWVFYKKEGSDDVLVKFLLNEHEASIPKLATDCAPYYHWGDVKAHFEAILAAQPEDK